MGHNDIHVDAAYFNAILKQKDAQFEHEVNEWLLNSALPNFKGDGTGYQLPPELKNNLKMFEYSLVRRGFSVKFHSDQSGTYLYLSIPPQDE